MEEDGMDEFEKLKELASASSGYGSEEVRLARWAVEEITRLRAQVDRLNGVTERFSGSAEEWEKFQAERAKKPD